MLLVHMKIALLAKGTTLHDCKDWRRVGKLSGAVFFFWIHSAQKISKGRAVW